MPADLRERLQTALGSAYRLERELSGGMSRVFVARETALDRQVVVKVLPPETSQTVSADRFRREIALAAQLQHPHIVPVLTAGEADGLLYYTMPLVEGESLRARLGTGARLPTGEALRILRDVASALAFAHAKGVVHRDIKPDNVLLAGDSATVADFGIAKALAASSQQHVTLTTQGLALGTPTYMAPEQAAGDDVDGRADLYALGAMAYELFTGCPPFQKPTPQAMLIAHAVERPKPLGDLRPDLPGALTRLVDAMLEKKPSDRPSSADDVVRALDAVSTPSGGSTTVKLRAPVRRRGWAPLAFLSALTLAVLAGARLWKGGAPAVRQPIILADFTANTADTSIGAIVTAALRSDLVQSPVVALLSEDHVHEALARAGRPRDAKVNLQLARELAQREGASAVIGGEVSSVGAQVLFVAHIVDAATGEEVGSARETASGDADMLAAMNRLSKALRERLGESARSLRGAPALARATTNSIEALRRYTRALELKENAATFGEAVASLEDAVHLDTTFALAWRELAEMRPTTSGRISAMRKAMEHRDRLGEAERAFTEATYYQYFDYDRDEAVRALRRTVELAPENATAWGNLGELLGIRFADDSGALVARRRALVASGYKPARFQPVIDAELALGDSVAAKRMLDSLSLVAPRSPEAQLSRAAWLTHEGRYAQADALADSMVAATQSQGDVNGVWRLTRSRLLVLQGRLREADEVNRTLVDLLDRQGRQEFALAMDFAFAQLLSRLRGPGPDIEARIDRSLRRFPPDRMNPEDPFYPFMAATAAWIGRPGLGRRVIDRWGRVQPADMRADSTSVWWALGDIALNEKKYELAAQYQGRAGDAMPGAEGWYPHRAHPHDLAGHSDSAVAMYTKYLSRTSDLVWKMQWLEAAHRAEALESLGINYENRQQPDSAAKYYQALLELWKDADPELEPRKKAIREALTRVTGEKEGVPLKAKP